MKLLRTMTLLAMLALWLPATNHCRLEQIPSLSFLACGDQEPGAPHPEDNCDSDGCALVESGLYKTEETHVDTGGPGCAVDVSLPPEVTTKLSCADRPPDFLAVSSLDFPVAWQFSTRNALPPRAPTAAS